MSDQVSLREFIQRVEAYQIDDPEKSLSFLDRLARENNWTTAYAERVILEYKRFCILAIQAGHPVTPSEHVDQAWHLHLTYTRSYWKGFCEGVLRQPLHHEPTAGGKAEGEKFRDWYGATLDSYRRIFNSQPPADIWPSINERFSNAGSWKWVNVGQSWVVPKRPVLFTASVAVSLAVVLFIAGCRPANFGANLGLSLSSMFSGVIPPFNLNGSEFLVFYIVVALVALLVMGVLGHRANLDIDSAQPDVKSQSLNAYKAAVLAGGGARLIQCVLTELTLQGCLKFEKQTWGRPPKMTATDKHPNAGAVADAVYNEVKSSSSPKLAAAIRPYYDKYVAELTSMNLRYPGRLKSSVAICIAGGVLFLGACRILQGLATNHSVGFLVVEMVLFSIVSAITLFRFKMVTQSGKTLLEQFHQQHRPELAPQAAGRLQVATDGYRAGAGSSELLWAVALTGVIGIAAVPELEMLKLTLERYKNGVTGGADGSGCGAGCGAGGCGGGGGGCGGGGCGGCGGCGG